MAPILPQKPLEKVGSSPPTFSDGLCGKRGPFKPQTSTSSGPEALLRNPTYNAQADSEHQKDLKVRIPPRKDSYSMLHNTDSGP